MICVRKLYLPFFPLGGRLVGRSFYFIILAISSIMDLPLPPETSQRVPFLLVCCTFPPSAPSTRLFPVPDPMSAQQNNFAST